MKSTKEISSSDVPLNPLVSVCIITYNHEKYISEAIDSVLIQKTNFPFEILIGEDGSRDETRNICINYTKKYRDKIRLFLNSRENVIYVNGYPTGRWNFLNILKNARGKYIALLEGDDYWTDPFKLQKQVDILDKHPEFIACHHWHKYAYKDNSGGYVEEPAPLVGYLPRHIGTVRDIFANLLRVKLRTTMYRNIFKKINFPPDWYMNVAFGDVPLSMIMGKYGDFYFIDEPMAVYRQTGEGVSSYGPEDSGNFLTYHFLNWISIWDLGNRHYKYKYNKEVIKTTCYFYNRIFQANEYKFTFCIDLLLKRFSTNKNPILRRFYEALTLFCYLFRGILIKFYKRVRRLRG